MKRSVETGPTAETAEIWYTVKFYHSRSSTCRNRGKSERIKYKTSSQAKLRVLVENTRGGKYFRGQNCRKCGMEARITVHC